MRNDTTKIALVLLAFLAATLPAAAAEPAQHPAPDRPYAGMETREIKSLSPDDVRELETGHGWGLSLAAELNGVPGPRHLLELADEIELTAEQTGRIEEIYREMKERAVPLGKELVRLERELDRSFANGTVDFESLGAQLDRISRVRRDLRYNHLAAHLRTPPLLTEAQMAAYVRLRGYDAADPCAAVPPGHDPEMWRRHNGCEDPGGSPDQDAGVDTF